MEQQSAVGKGWPSDGLLYRFHSGVPLLCTKKRGLFAALFRIVRKHPVIIGTPIFSSLVQYHAKHTKTPEPPTVEIGQEQAKYHHHCR